MPTPSIPGLNLTKLEFSDMATYARGQVLRHRNARAGGQENRGPRYRPQNAH